MTRKELEEQMQLAGFSQGEIYDYLNTRIEYSQTYAVLEGDQQFNMIAVTGDGDAYRMLITTGSEWKCHKFLKVGSAR